ncbi:GC-rich sequence DNA-binding factor-like protein-domain-containing protein [Limtongia smithiae]|uniref:GC-rich sequence DNA-binding factor-like protein-domain-containing protein n=1 Tax=Limtongia smithiae TaxID=1125753 RepID=UPI0034CE40FC
MTTRSDDSSADDDDEFNIRSFRAARGGLGGRFPGGDEGESSDEDGGGGKEKRAAKPLRYSGISFAASAVAPSNPLDDLETSESTQPSPSLTGNTKRQPSQAQTQRPPPRAPPQNAASARISSAYGKGASMFAKMGYVEGSGLGVRGQGILNPVEQKLRGGRVGLGGIKEKTASSIREAKRRGEHVSSDEEEGGSDTKRARKAKGSGVQQERARGPKVIYRTFEDMKASSMPVPGFWKDIIDMTGGEPKVLDSMSDFKGALDVGADVSEREIIANTAQLQLENYADQWESLQAQKGWILGEVQRITVEFDAQNRILEKLDKIREIAEAMKAKSGNDDSVQDLFTSVLPYLDDLEKNYRAEMQEYKLDDIPIAVLTPILCQLYQSWSPLTNPEYLKSYFLRWQHILHVLSSDAEGHGKIAKDTLFESMMVKTWLPPVRHTILNDWKVRDPLPVINLLETWHDVVPAFIQEQLIAQVVLPKLRAAVNEWSPKPTQQPVEYSSLLHTWIFPWMPLLGTHLQPLIADVKQRYRSVLRAWDVSRGVIEDLRFWRDVFSRREIDSMLMKYTYPKLVRVLKSDFQVNPADQDMAPLNSVLAWSSYFGSGTFAELLEEEFFPKWYDVLFMWVTSEPVFDEVAQWYEFWTTQFPARIGKAPTVQKGFARGLELIQRAKELGPRAAERLRPIKIPRREHRSARSREAKAEKKRESRTPHSREEIPLAASTLKDVVEEYCLSSNILFMPLRKAHPLLGYNLYRITASADGKGGFVGYFENEVLWAKVQGRADVRRLEWEPLDYMKIGECAGFR